MNNHSEERKAKFWSRKTLLHSLVSLVPFLIISYFTGKIEKHIEESHEFGKAGHHSEESEKFAVRFEPLLRIQANVLAAIEGFTPWELIATYVEVIVDPKKAREQAQSYKMHDFH